MKSNGLAGKAFWSLTSQVFSRGSLMISAVFLTRTLSTEEFAAYSYFQLTVSMLSTYAAMGLGVTSSRYFSEVGHEKKGNEPFPLGMLWAASILLAIIAFLALIIIPDGLINAGLTVPKWLVACGVFALTMEVVPGGAILGLEKYKQASLISMIAGSLIIMGALIASWKTAPIIAMSTIVVATLFQGIGEAAIVIRTVGWKRLSVRAHSTANELYKIVSFAGPMLLVSLMAASGSWIVGRLILLSKDGVHGFAIYTIGLQWFAFALVLPGMVSRVILPRVVRSANDDLRDQKKMVWQGIWMASGTAIAAALIGSAFAPNIIKLYGAQYQNERWLLSGYLIAAVLSAPSNTVGNAIIAKNGQKQWLFITVIWLTTLMLVSWVTMKLEFFSGSLSLACAAATQTAIAIFAARVKKII